MSGNNERVAIFWDHDNCRFANIPGREIVNNIRNLARNFGSISLFKAYLESSIQMPSKSIYHPHRSELQSSGVVLADFTNDKHGSMSTMMLVDMLAFAIDNPAPATIVLISGDPDCAYAVSILELRHYRVVLVVPPKGAPHSLRSPASLVLDWNNEVLRNSDTMNPLRSLINQDIPFYSAPLRDMEYDSRIQPRKGKSKPLDVDLEPRTVRDKRRDETREALHDPHPDSFLRDFGGDRQVDRRPPIIEPFPRRYLDSINTFAPSTLSIPQVQPPPVLPRPIDFMPFFNSQNENINMSLPDSLPRIPGSMPPLNATDASSSLRMPSLSSASAPFVPSFLSGAFSTKTITPPPDLPVPANTSSIPINRELPKQASIEPYPQPLRFPTPEEKRVSSISSPSSAGSSLDDSAQNPAAVVPGFDKLMDILRTFLSQGNPRPLRSVIGSELAKHGVYKRAGVQNFGEYVALAEKEGIVEIGGTGVPGREWISLHPDHLVKA